LEEQLMDHPQIKMRPVGELRAYAGNARTHSKKQIKQIAASISRFGFTNPVLISDDSEIIAGQGLRLMQRILAARSGDIQIQWREFGLLATIRLVAA
jgi:ParB-like chromosome segregation protein Spo0J